MISQVILYLDICQAGLEELLAIRTAFLAKICDDAFLACFLAAGIGLWWPKPSTSMLVRAIAS